VTCSAITNTLISTRDNYKAKQDDEDALQWITPQNKHIFFNRVARNYQWRQARKIVKHQRLLYISIRKVSTRNIYNMNAIIRVGVDEFLSLTGSLSLGAASSMFCPHIKTKGPLS
jgi:hypothetical protein